MILEELKKKMKKDYEPKAGMLRKRTKSSVNKYIRQFILQMIIADVCMPAMWKFSSTLFCQIYEKANE